MKIEDDQILYKYLKLTVTSQCKKPSIRSDGRLWFRCNICKDSKESKIKKRGWILYLHDEWRFKCWNCGKSMKAKYWLKRYFPSFYSLYLKEVLQSSNKEQSFNYDFKKQKSKQKTKIQIISLKNNTELTKKAKSYCESRKIKSSIYNKWYVCTDKKSKFYRRLILPVFDKNNNIVFWQGRSLDGNGNIKYLNSNKNIKNAIVEQMKKLDRKKPIIVLEGFIDSLFVENSLCVFSINWSYDLQKLFDRYKCYYMLDGDKNNEQVYKRKILLLKNNKYVFNWNKYLKQNKIENREKWDINDLYIYYKRENNFKFDDFEKYFTHNWYDKIYMK